MSLLRLLFFTLLFSLLNLNLFAQEVAVADVPYDVKETMFARFQRVTEAKWTKPKPDVYHVTFKKGDRSLAAEFGADGRWLSTMQTISTGEVPRDIVASLAKGMKGHKMKKALKQETLLRGLVYTVTTQKDGKTYDFTFNPSGKLLYYTEPDVATVK